MTSLKPTLGTFVCKECKQVIRYNFEQRIQEDQWEQLCDLGVPSPSKLLNATQTLTNNRLLHNNHQNPAENILEQSFVMIQSAFDKGQQLANSSSSSPSQNMKPIEIERLDKIVQISAGHAQVEHPLCETCVKKVMDKLNAKLEDLNSEKLTFCDYINQWENAQQRKEVNVEKINTRQRNSINTSINTRWNANNKPINEKAYHEEIHKLQKQLQEVLLKKKRLGLELEQLETESLRMNKFEELFFCDANDFWYSIENLSMQHAAVRQKIREVSTHLETMKRTNVFDDAFHIYHDGHFGTINGLRLGRLKSVKVEWEEINTGLGQCVLLLDVLSQRCNTKNFKFVGYELYPMGSASFIKEKVNSKGKNISFDMKKRFMKNANANANTNNQQKVKHNVLTHHMFGSNQTIWGHKKCDKALECFLQCIKQFADWMFLQDDNFRLRYEIRGPLIGDAKTDNFLPIRFNLSEPEIWTQALKYMVIDLKYLLAWVARFSP